jgi:hypothetical protein
METETTKKNNEERLLQHGWVFDDTVNHWKHPLTNGVYKQEEALLIQDWINDPELFKQHLHEMNALIQPIVSYFAMNVKSYFDTLQKRIPEVFASIDRDLR